MKTPTQSMKLSFGSLLIAFAMAQFVFGQQGPQASSTDQNTSAAQCPLTLAQLPSFRGLRLGMSEAEVRKHFASHSKYGNTDVWNSADQHLHLCVRGCANATSADEDSDEQAAEPALFQGISAVHFTLGQVGVEQLTIYFEDQATPADAVEFSAVIAGTLGLPPAWRANRYLAVMQCRGFRVRIEGQDENKLALLVTEVVESAQAVKR
jgi:hypothetical protein